MPDQFLVSLMPYFGIVALLVALACIISAARGTFGRKKNDEQDKLWEEPDIIELRASVVSQRCGVGLVGTKNVHSVKSFLVTFRTEDGKVVEYDVPEEFYVSVESGQGGILAICNGNLYGFYPDENSKKE